MEKTVITPQNNAEDISQSLIGCSCNTELEKFNKIPTWLHISIMFSLITLTAESWLIYGQPQQLQYQLKNIGITEDKSLNLYSFSAATGFIGLLFGIKLMNKFGDAICFIIINTLTMISQIIFIIGVYYESYAIISVAWAIFGLWFYFS